MSLYTSWPTASAQRQPAASLVMLARGGGSLALNLDRTCDGEVQPRVLMAALSISLPEASPHAAICRTIH